ncbi:MAG TPA: HAD-IC family P-type ATPase [Acetobacteraceae bacterium]|nr:HAD-IC family P-type ATPase [Acetobacteraceae bacterium]
MSPWRFAFVERLRVDARDVLARLRRFGVAVQLVSDDRPELVAHAAEALGIQDWKAGCSPVDKVATIEQLTAQHSVLMVGDGLIDSPSLAAATVSVSPSSAANISQMGADVVFQGHCLLPGVAVIEVARRAQAVMRQNLALAIGYNVPMVRLADWVTSWLAVAAMSCSLVLVMANRVPVGRETLE